MDEDKVMRYASMLAPCGNCHAHKGELLESVPTQNDPLITDLVVDSVTVRQMLNRESSSAG